MKLTEKQFNKMIEKKALVFCEEQPFNDSRIACKDGNEVVVFIDHLHSEPSPEFRYELFNRLSVKEYETMYPTTMEGEIDRINEQNKQRGL